MVRERIKSVPEIEFVRLEVLGERVLLVRVLSGDDPPYSTQENQVFVRKGATNRRPDPKTEIPALLDRGHLRRTPRMMSLEP
ncbi:hypothetical protein HY251_00215 [bacterium]|nr:hypothetical protein [bacterium]